MFTEALFTIAKTQTTQMSINRWTDKEDGVHTYIIEYYSAMKKSEILPSAATWMDLEIIRQWSKSERERQIPYDITYMWNLKYNTNEHIYKTETYS